MRCKGVSARRATARGGVNAPHVINFGHQQTRRFRGHPCLGRDWCGQIDDKRPPRDQPPHDGKSCFTRGGQQADQIGEAHGIVARMGKRPFRQRRVDRCVPERKQSLRRIELRSANAALGRDTEVCSVASRP